MPCFDAYSETLTGLHYIIWPDGITKYASHIYLSSWGCISILLCYINYSSIIGFLNTW